MIAFQLITMIVFVICCYYEHIQNELKKVLAPIFTNRPKQGWKRGSVVHISQLLKSYKPVSFLSSCSVTPMVRCLFLIIPLFWKVGIKLFKEQWGTKLKLKKFKKTDIGLCENQSLVTQYMYAFATQSLKHSKFNDRIKMLGIQNWWEVYVKMLKIKQSSKCLLPFYPRFSQTRSVPLFLFQQDIIYIIK